MRWGSSWNWLLSIAVNCLSQFMTNRALIQSVNWRIAWIFPLPVVECSSVVMAFVRTNKCVLIITNPLMAQHKMWGCHFSLGGGGELLKLPLPVFHGQSATVHSMKLNRLSFMLTYLILAADVLCRLCSSEWGQFIHYDQHLVLRLTSYSTFYFLSHVSKCYHAGTCSDRQ